MPVRSLILPEPKRILLDSYGFLTHERLTFILAPTRQPLVFVMGGARLHNERSGKTTTTLVHLESKTRAIIENHDSRMIVGVAK